ncbi:hypothetical protein [Kitasatospora phosalacinea]|uniref:Uncharacterized protein n=1 Tax=Kitasatospora phosalacinea TaxID=2065 RepID=A0A9W6PDG9_9ACTN|nr:hypothetical protein [Kitasatospora phosalacinea]GLW53885.1 hypothetical protein Kpho01_18960 [Kitasatospora phosalacinea]
MPLRPRHPRTLLAFAALLDASIDRIAELAADAREFDRDEVYRLADVWDNNTYALFRAATARFRWMRELQARWALRWLADLGNQRRAWVVERTAAAGVPVERLLLPPGPEPVPDRWHRFGSDVLSADLTPRTPERVDELAADYDLASAVLRSLRVQRRGSERLDCWFDAEVPCRYAGGEDGYANLWISLEDPVELDVDTTADATGLTLRTDPDGVTLRIGSAVALRCRSLELTVDDFNLRASPCGSRLAAAHPEAPERRRAPERELPVFRSAFHAHRAGQVLHRAMLTARWADARAPLTAITTALSGAGQQILAAGAIRRRSARNAAFRALVADWCRRGGPDFVAPVAARVDLPAEFLPAADPPPPAVHALPSRLHRVRCRLSNRHDPESRHTYVECEFAQPPADAPEAPWVLRAHDLHSPVSLRFGLDAFHRTAVPALTPGRLTLGPHLTATGTPEPC